jgi:PhnB protein
MKIVPYLFFAGNAQEAIDFYADALGGKVARIQRYGESPAPTDEDWKQKVMHSRIEFGDDVLMISDGSKGQPVKTDGNIQITVETEDLDSTEKMFSKLSSGGKVAQALKKEFWGDYFGMLQDKFGVSWMFNCSAAKN